MKGDLPAAAFRLLLALPVHTHERTRATYEDRLPNNLRGVVIGSTHYESLTEAARQTGVSRTKIRNMIALGRARYR